jgi:hypothetical protein
MKFIQHTFVLVQGDQKISVRLMITVQSSGAQRLFDHPIYLTRVMLSAC